MAQQYWANRALDVLRSNIVLSQIVAKDVNFGETGWRGKSITVPYPGKFTPVDKAADTPVTPQVPVGGQSVTLTLDKHKVVPFLVEDFGAAQASQSLMDRYLQPAAIAMVEQFEQDLFFTASGVGSIAPTGTAGTDLAAAVVRTDMQRLNEAKAPVGNRSLVISPKDEAALLGDSNLATYFAFSQADAIRNGYTGRLYGMDVFMSQLAPPGYKVVFGSVDPTLSFNGQTTSALNKTTTTAAQLQTALAGLSSVGAGLVKVSGLAGGPFSVVFDASINSTGTLTTTGTGSSATAAQINLALHQNAVMFAVRPFAPIPASAGVSTAIANDPESGLSIRVSSQYDVNNIGVRVNLDMLYGTTVLRPSQGIITFA